MTLEVLTPREARGAVELSVDGHAVRISSPDRVYFPARGVTKLDLAEYYISVGEGIVQGPLLQEQPMHPHDSSETASAGRTDAR